MAIEIVFGAAGLLFTRATNIREVPIEPMPSDPIDEPDGRVGFWVDVRDANDRVVYRRILNDRGNVIEGPGETSEMFVSVRRVERAPLHVIVPHVPGGRVVLMSNDNAARRIDVRIDAALPGIA
jgi:hypothetical protein